MANAKRDDNREIVGLGWDSTNSTPLQLKVDPVTGRLLITISSSNSSPTKHSQPAKRDDNRIPVGLGTDDDGTAAVAPLHTKSTGFLSIDFI